MSAAEDNTDVTLPCVLITSSDSDFKEEELVKREYLGLEGSPKLKEASLP